MQDELVEAMARAMWERAEQINWEGSGREPKSWEDASNATNRFLGRDYAQAALAAIKANGFAVVPVEPTEAMLRDVAAACRDFYSEDGPYPRAKAVYRAMIKATP
jgi:hypothetical protein